MKKCLSLIVVLILLPLMTACTAAKVIAEEAVLTVGGKEYTSSQLEALGSMSTKYTNKDGETTTYTGVQLIAILEDAGLSGDTLVFTAADGYQADVALDEVFACSDCVVSLDNGRLRLIMPEMSSKLQVRDLVEISAQ